MSKKEKSVDLIPDTGVTSGWKVKHDGKEGSNPNQSGPNPYPKLKLDEDSGSHLLVFSLPKGGNVKFNSTDPMWIQKTDPANPTSPTVSGMDPQFPAWAVLNEGKTLVVVDLNTVKATYAYRVKADNYSTVLDPIVDNGGGSAIIDPPGLAPGGRYSESQYITAAAIGLLVGLLIGFLVHKMFFSPRQVG